METLSHYSTVIAAWAAQHQSINRAWIFGSYAKGTATQKSDLDVAIEIHKASIGHIAIDTYWYRYSSSLEESLQTLIAIPLDLELYHRYHGSRICGFVRELKLGPVYRRP